MPGTAPGPERLKSGDELDYAEDRMLFPALFALAVIYLWIVPLRSSLWLDETATYWVIKDGIANVISRSLNWSGQSPLYYLTAWLAYTVGGRSEWVLRLPSLISCLLAAWLLFRLASRLFDRTTAHLAVLAFACSESVVFAAADARPYALGLCLLIGSALALVDWLDTGRSRYAAGYVLLSALAIYAHYFFAPVCAVLGFYGASRSWSEKKIGLWRLIAAWGAVGILLLPLVSQVLHFYRTRTAHSYIGTPDFSDLLAGFAPSVLLASIAVSVLLAWLIAPPLHSGPPASKRNIALAAAWAATPPLLLYAVSVLSPAKIFLPRYYISYAPGLSLLAAWVVRSLVTGFGRRMAAMVIVLGSIASFGRAYHGEEDWADAMRKVRSLADNANLPVVIASGFVESADPKVFDDPALQEVLFAPVQMYPPGGRLIRLPYRLDEKSEPYVERVVAGLRNETRFVVVVRFQGILFESWLRGRFAAEGFRSEPLGYFQNVGVFLFRRS